MIFSEVCRTCLRSETLNPIFNDKDDHSKCSNAVYMATGVQVHIDDNLPQNICSECLNRINSTLRFRKQCKIVENELLQIKSGLKLNPMSDIHETTIVEESNQVDNINTIKYIDCLPNICVDITYDNIKDIKEEEIRNEAKISLLKTDEFDHDIKKTMISLTHSLPDTFHNDNDNISDDGIELDKIEVIDIKPATRKTIEKVDLSKIFNETENSLGDSFFNDDKLIISHNDNKTDTEQTNQTKNIDLSIISVDETDKEVSISINNINESDINNDMIITNTNKIKSKRKSTKKPQKIPLNERVDSSKNAELPYNVLPGGRCDKISRVVCKMCAKELSIRSIDSHMARCHPGADERKVKCDLCDKHVLKEKLNRHIILMHGSGYKCGYCKSEFKNRPTLLEHIQSCSAKKRKASRSGREMTECDECHQKMQKASLRMHKAIKHAGLRPVCEHCGRSFGNKLRLDEHRRAKHGYDKFRCSRCQFTSASSAAMRNHERRHRGEKPFVCETCGAKFHAAYLLAQHRHSHRTERTVKCDLCPASFKANNSLHMHRLACHGARVFTCGLCARAYRCRHYALRHLRLVHRHAGGGGHIVPSDVT